MTADHGKNAPEETGRTVAVLARLDTSDVHRAVRALPRNRQQDLAKALRVPATALTEAPTAAAVLGQRTRRMTKDQASRLGRDVVAVCAGEVVDALGGRADDPSYDDILAVLDPLVESWGPRLVALLLAATADGGFPARAVCEQLLDDDPRFVLDALGPEQVDAPRHPAAAIARPTDAEDGEDTERAAKREERRRRREQQKQRAGSATGGRSPGRRRYRRRAGPDAPRAESSAIGDAVTARPAAPADAGEAPRRHVAVASRFEDVRYHDPLVGSVVVAFIPFRDPDTLQASGKNRPCVVMAACAGDRLVVRPCYSEGGLQSRTWRSARIGNPRAAGLDRSGYVSSEEHAVPRSRISAPIGRLTREDWNML